MSPETYAVNQGGRWRGAFSLAQLQDLLAREHIDPQCQIRDELGCVKGLQELLGDGPQRIRTTSIEELALDALESDEAPQSPISRPDITSIPSPGIPEAWTEMPQNRASAILPPLPQSSPMELVPLLERKSVWDSARDLIAAPDHSSSRYVIIALRFAGVIFLLAFVGFILATFGTGEPLWIFAAAACGLVALACYVFIEIIHYAVDLSNESRKLRALLEIIGEAIREKHAL